MNSRTRRPTSPNISEAAVTKAVKIIVELLNFVFKAVYKKTLPAYNRGRSSRLASENEATDKLGDG